TVLREGQQEVSAMSSTADEEALLRRARDGDASARAELLARHRDRLRQMVAVRMDRRLLARIDPSDVVQEALLDAHARLPGHLKRHPGPFSPGLRARPLDRLTALHRRHLHAQKRSVGREEIRRLALPDESAVRLADRLVASGTSPSGRAVREELRYRVR